MNQEIAVYNTSHTDQGNPARLDVDRWLVKTGCQLCFLDVGHSRRGEEWKFITVGLLSTHVGWWSGQLRTRVAEAWRVLRGCSYPFIELYDVHEIDALIEALQAAREEAFGSDQPPAAVKPVNPS